MANVIILNLPPEILHSIFDQCDTHTVFHSIRYVCKLFYNTVNSYKAKALSIVGDSSYNFNLILHLSRPESITSLVLSNSRRQKDQIPKFFSNSTIRAFQNLRSLTLNDVESSDVQKLFDDGLCASLRLLSIQFRWLSRDQSVPVISSAISQPELRTLSLNADTDIMRSVLWPDHSDLEHLIIGACSYDDYPMILNGLSKLKILSMNRLQKGYYDQTILSLSMLKFKPLLISLTINHCCLRNNDFGPLFSLTPALRHLKLINKDADSEPFFDGSFWETCLSTNLPYLTDFQCFFSRKCSSYEQTFTLDELLVPFQSPYWLDAKRWFISCDYHLPENYLRLYTSSFDVNQQSHTIVVSPQDNLYTLVRSVYDREVSD